MAMSINECTDAVEQARILVQLAQRNCQCIDMDASDERLLAAAKVQHSEARLRLNRLRARVMA